MFRSSVRLLIWSLLNWLFAYNTKHCLAIFPVKAVASRRRVRSSELVTVTVTNLQAKLISCTVENHHSRSILLSTESKMLKKGTLQPSEYGKAGEG